MPVTHAAADALRRQQPPAPTALFGARTACPLHAARAGRLHRPTCLAMLPPNADGIPVAPLALSQNGFAFDKPCPTCAATVVASKDFEPNEVILRIPLTAVLQFK